MTLIEYPEIEQGTPEWHDQRRGIVTASAVGKLVTVKAPGALDFACPSCEAAASSPCVSKARKAGADPTPIKTVHPERTAYATEHRDEVEPRIEVAVGKEADDLTANLVAERIANYTEPSFMNDDMWRGVLDEPRARDHYSEHYSPATETGFMVEDKWGFKIGFSPDGLVGSDGLVAGDGLLEVKSRRQKKHLLTILNNEVPPENMAQLQCGLLVSGRKWIDYVSYCGGWPMWRIRVEPDPKWQEAIVAAVRQFEKNAAEMVDRYLSLTDGLPVTERIVEMEIVL